MLVETMLCKTAGTRCIYLHLIFEILQFEISSLMNWIFFLVWTGFLKATQAVKIQFKLGKKSNWSNSKFKTGECQKSSADRYCRGLDQFMCLKLSRSDDVKFSERYLKNSDTYQIFFTFLFIFSIIDFFGKMKKHRIW